MYGTSDAMVVPFAQEVGDHNIGTDGQADKKIDEQIDDRGTGSDRCQCRMSGELADDGYVGRIEKLLQHSTGGYRHGKREQTTWDRTLEHIGLQSILVRMMSMKVEMRVRDKHFRQL